MKIKYDLYFLKKFIKDYLSNDLEGLIDSFFREMTEVIQKNAEIDDNFFDKNKNFF